MIAEAQRETGMVAGGDAAKLGIGIVTDERMKKTYDMMVAMNPQTWDRDVAEIDRRSVDVRTDATGGNIDDQALDREARHALGRIDGEAHDVFNRIEIGDHAGLDAMRTLVPETDHLDIMRAARQHGGFTARRQASDNADDLGRTDIENRNDMRPLGRQRPGARKTEGGATKDAHIFCSSFLSSLVRVSTAS